MFTGNISDRIKSSLQDIRFWILLFFLIRLFGIADPPLEVAHNWRQSMGTMVARNFLETDNNIFYPRIDCAGEKTGITGMEFPLFNYFIYLQSALFGYAHWYGRLINLIISSLGLFFFYKLTLKYFEKSVAFNAAIVLLFSIWLMYSRKIMPDTISMSLMIAGAYYGTNYLEGKSRRDLLNLILYGMFVALGVLLKLSSVYLLAVFAVFLVSKRISTDRKIIFSLASLVSISFPAMWYFYWVPHLFQQYGYSFYMGKDILEGIREIVQNASSTLFRFYDTALKYSGFALFLFGLYIAVRKKNKLLLAVFLLTFLAFLLFIFKAGFNFPHHSYYVIPFVPVMALVCGYGIDQVKNKKLGMFLLIVIATEGLLNQQDDFRIHQKDLALLNLEADLDKVSSRNDLILINSGEYPTPMYFAHRKGWLDYNEKITDENFLRQLKEKGLKYVVILKRSFGSNVVLGHEIALDNEDYCIYKL